MRLLLAVYAAANLTLISGLCALFTHNPDRIAGSAEDVLYLRWVLLTIGLLCVTILLGGAAVTRKRLEGDWPI